MNVTHSLGRGAFALASLTLATLAGNAQADQIVSYFNFNSLVNQSTVDVATIAPTLGNGSLVTDFSMGGVTALAGTTINAQPGDPAGQALGLLGGASEDNNSHYLEYRVNTTGYSNLTLSFAIQGSASGFNSDMLSVSVNGGTSYTNIGSAFNPPAGYVAAPVDLSAFPALNNNPNVRFRFTFSGATSATGYNRLDNLTLSSAPAPSSALVLLAGAVPLIGALRRKRK